MALASAAESADPAIPSAGNGPMPRISSGLKITSSTTVRIVARIGVVASPAPRSPIATIIASTPNGIETMITRKYANASGCASGGVDIRRSSWGAKIQPSSAMIAESPVQNPTPPPNASRAPTMSRAPNLRPTSTVVAIPNPKTVPNAKNISVLALAVAASAFSPSSRPTHTVLIEPLMVWAMLAISAGIANTTSARRIGPLVRSPFG